MKQPTNWLTPWLMEPRGSISRSEGLSNNSFHEPNEAYSRTDTYFSKIHSSIIFPYTLRPLYGSLSCRFTCWNFESSLTFFHSNYMICPSKTSGVNHLDYIRWTVQTMKFLIVQPSALHIRILLGFKYSLIGHIRNCLHTKYWNGNLNSSMVKSSRLVIWRSVV